MFLICQQTGKNKNGVADLELYKNPFTLAGHGHRERIFVDYQS